LSRITGVTEPSYALANQLRSGLRLPNHDNLDRLLGRFVAINNSSERLSAITYQFDATLHGGQYPNLKIDIFLPPHKHRLKRPVIF
jgi:hypothetical protein